MLGRVSTWMGDRLGNPGAVGINPLPRLKSKNGKDFPEEGKVGAEGLWFRKAPREANIYFYIFIKFFWLHETTPFN